jgi:hypothetical protein
VRKSARNSDKLYKTAIAPERYRCLSDNMTRPIENKKKWTVMGSSPQYHAIRHTTNNSNNNDNCDNNNINNNDKHAYASQTD